MPARAPARCTICPSYATHHGRCDDHQRKAWANPSANTRALTGRQRATFRNQVLAAAHGRCNWCGGPATQADHILAISLGGSPTDATNNGQALCDDCHTLKTEADIHQARKKSNQAP